MVWIFLRTSAAATVSCAHCSLSSFGTVRLLRSGWRRLGVLAALGAVGFGFNSVACFCGVNEARGIDTTDDAE